ncbi:MAG: hypothetical protein ABFR75_05095 [Acidobacteriota bacterium]
MNQKGKLTVTGIITILLVFYGIFAAIKIISANITEDQVQKDIKDRIGIERGYGFTEERAMEIIVNTLKKHSDIVFDPDEEGVVDVTIDDEKKLIIYYFEYELVTNYIFFEKRKKITQEEDMQNFR